MAQTDDVSEKAKASPEETPDALLPLGEGLEQSLNFRIRMAQILSFRHFEKQHPGYGGAARFLGLLSIIQANPGEPQNRLAEAVGLQRSSVVPILDRMEGEGIVERRDDEGDRRAKAVFLTDKGEQVVGRHAWSRRLNPQQPLGEDHELVANVDQQPHVSRVAGDEVEQFAVDCRARG